MDRKQVILATIDDLVIDFLYYDRKEDEDLPLGAIRTAVDSKEISIEEMIERFAKGLRSNGHSKERKEL